MTSANVTSFSTWCSGHSAFPALLARETRTSSWPLLTDAFQNCWKHSANSLKRLRSRQLIHRSKLWSESCVQPKHANWHAKRQHKSMTCLPNLPVLETFPAYATVPSGLQTFRSVKRTWSSSALKDVGCPVVTEMQNLWLCVLPHRVPCWCNRRLKLATASALKPWPFILLLTGITTRSFSACIIDSIFTSFWNDIREVQVLRWFLNQGPGTSFILLIADLNLDILVNGSRSRISVTWNCFWVDKSTTTCAIWEVHTIAYLFQHAP